MGFGSQGDGAVAPLVDMLYESMLEPGMWQRFIDRAVEVFQADSGHLLSFERFGSAGFWVRNAIDPSALAAYERHYHKVDPWQAAIPELAPGASFVARGERLVDDRAFLASEFYNDFLKPIDQRWVCGASVRPSARRSARYALAVFRSAGREPFGDAAERACAEIASHLQRVERLASAAMLFDPRAGAGAEAHAEAAEGAFLLSGSGRLVACNAAGEALIAEGVVTPGVQRVALSLPASDAWLRLAVAEQGTRGAPEGTRRFTARAADGSRYELALVPLRTPGPSLGLGAARSLLTVTRVVSFEVHGAWRPSLFARFHWTRAEADTVRRLAAGESLDAIAAARACSRETVRSHLKSAKRKAGVSRQVDLIRLVMRLADPRAALEAAH